MADAESLTIAFLRSHPEDAARVLEAAPSAQAASVLDRVPARVGALVLQQMLPAAAARTLAELDDERALQLLSTLDRQSLVAILRQIGEPRRAQWLGRLPAAAALTSKLLLAYPDNAIGAWADPNVIAIAANTRVADILQRVRNMDVPVDRLFIVNDERRLCGWVSLDRLIRAPASAAVDSIMSPTDAVIAAHAPLAATQSHPGWLMTSTLPVVDPQRHVVGVLTRDAFERARTRMSHDAPASTDEPALAEIALGSYWNVLSGIFESVLLLLPTVRKIAQIADRGEHR